jgi:hypothetical protein
VEAKRRSDDNLIVERVVVLGIASNLALNLFTLARVRGVAIRPLELCGASQDPPLLHDMRINAPPHRTGWSPDKIECICDGILVLCFLSN